MSSFVCVLGKQSANVISQYVFDISQDFASVNRDTNLNIHTSCCSIIIDPKQTKIKWVTQRERGSKCNRRQK